MIIYLTFTQQNIRLFFIVTYFFVYFNNRRELYKFCNHFAVSGFSEKIRRKRLAKTCTVLYYKVVCTYTVGGESPMMDKKEAKYTILASCYSGTDS